MKRTGFKPPQPRQKQTLIPSSTLKRAHPIKYASDKRRAEAESRSKIRETVFERDQRCVLADLLPSHRCFGDDTPHHVLKASRGGPYSEANMVQLCASANTWVEDYPTEAESLGLSLPSGPCVKSQLLYDPRAPDAESECE